MNYDLLLHIDSGQESALRMCLRNAENYLNALPGEKFELQLVANGGAAGLFKANAPELRKKAEELATRGLVIKVCANAMAEHGIAKEDLWPICEVVPAGLVEIVNLQRRGFAYVKP